MSEQENEGVDVVEAVDQYVTDEGDIVTDDVTVGVDEASGDALVDEVVSIEAADGSFAAEETITAISGEDGSSELLADVVEIGDGQGNVAVADLLEDEE